MYFLFYFFNMCYAIPGKIIQINKDTALVDYSGIKKKANISLINNIKIGDFVLVHAGFAIQKIQKKTALESLKAIEDHIKNIDKKNQ